MKEIIRQLKCDGITLEQIGEELDYRERSSLNWDDALIKYSTEELEQIEIEW